MTMSNHDRAQRAARAMHAKATPEERKARSRRAYLAGATRAVTTGWHDLTAEQQSAIRTVACA